VFSDDLLTGPAQELDFSSSEEEEESVPVITGRNKKSKQADRPSKIIPTASDESSDEDDEEEEEITGKNIIARSKALDARSAREAQLDVDELQAAEAAGLDEDDFADADMDDAEEGEEDIFALPSLEQREEEKARGGPDLPTVQRRMRECQKVLRNFARLGAGRFVCVSYEGKANTEVCLSGQDQNTPSN
jgi:ribosomal RNA methyltransferase Nop2